MDITFDRVIQAARRRLAALTPELAAYVILLMARELERPARISFERVSLDDSGQVRVRAGDPAGEAEIEAELRGMLRTLLALCPSLPPAIAAVPERGTGVGLRGFEAELMAALIPINPAAAGRALARAYRETQRALIDGVDLAPAAEPAAKAELDGASVKPIAAAPIADPLGVEVGAPESLAGQATLGAPRVADEPLDLEIDVELDSVPTPNAPSSSDSIAATRAHEPESALLAEGTVELGEWRGGEPEERGDETIAQVDPAAAQQPEVTPARESEPPLERTPATQLDPEPALQVTAPAEAALSPQPELAGSSLDSSVEARLPAEPAEPRIAIPPALAAAPLLVEPGPIEEDFEPALAEPVREMPPVATRRGAAHSDVDELVRQFLAHTRSEEAMTLTLRRAVGLDRRARGRTTDGRASPV